MPQYHSVTVSLKPDQIDWLDDHDDSRSELVRQALAEEFGI